ncbi:hypothetical protein D3C81_1317250 [compost metagenome]
MSGAFWPTPVTEHLEDRGGVQSLGGSGYAMAGLPGVLRNSQCETHGAEYSRTIKFLLQCET